MILRPRLCGMQVNVECRSRPYGIQVKALWNVGQGHVECRSRSCGKYSLIVAPHFKKRFLGAGGGNPSGWSANLFLIFGNIFPKNCMKIPKDGAYIRSAPSMDQQLDRKILRN